MNNETEEKIDRARGEREADRIIHQLRMRELHEPQRKQAAEKQLAEDKEAFTKICRQHLLSECQANFRLFRSTHSISGLAPASQEELARWNAQAVEEHNESLQRMDPDQLRARVRQEAADSRVQQAQAETDRQLEALRTKDAPFGYQPLPTEFTKENLLQMVKDETEKYRFIVKKFGNHNITVRLQGRG